MSDAERRQKEFKRAKRLVDPVRTAAMDSPQTTTDSYALVSESKIQPEGRKHIGFVVEETGDSNAVDARVVKRFKDDNGDFGPWAPDNGSDAEKTNIGAGGAGEVTPSDSAADQYGVEVKANAGGSQGDVKVTGAARAEQ